MKRLLLLSALFMFLFSSRVLAGWTQVDLGSGGSAMNQVAVGSGRIGDSTMRVYGANGDTHIYEFAYSGGIWTKTDLNYGEPTAGRSWSCVAVGDGRSDGSMHVYGNGIRSTGDNGNDYLYEFTWSGTSWTQVSLGSSAYAWRFIAVGKGRADVLNRVYAASSDYHLYEFYFVTGTGWTQSDMGAGTNNMFGVAVGNGRNDATSHVYGACDDTHIYEYTYGIPWTKVRISTNTGSFPALGVAVGNGRNDGVTRVYGVYSDGYVYEYSYSAGASSWTEVNMGSCGGQPNAVAIGAGRSDGLMHVYTAASTVYEFTYSTTTKTWASVDTGVTANGVTIGAGRNDGVMRLYRASPDDHIYEFSYSPLYTISGYVRDSVPLPIVGAIVTISGGSSGTTATAADGSFQFPNLTSALSYTITPSKTGYSFSPLYTTVGSLTSDLGFNFTGTFVSTYSIIGFVYNSSSQPVSGVSMTLSGSVSNSVTTVANGSYSFSNLTGGGNFTVTPSMTGYSFNPISKSTISLSGYINGWNFTANSTNPPVLSWEPGYPNGAIQSSATVTTMINFGIHYADPNALAPKVGYPKLHIANANNIELTGSPFVMNAGQATGDFMVGRKYIYDFNINVPGAYRYWFEACNTSSVYATGVELQGMLLNISQSNTSTGGTTLTNAHPYPSFANLSQGGTINFAGITPSADIKIFTLAGNLIKTLKADANGVVPTWDGSIDGGGKASSGTYMVRASDSSGNKKTFKILLVK